MSYTSGTFTSKDQLIFANLSGDYNEIHLTEKVARRSILGYPIVHGINLILWAIETELSNNEFQSIVNLQASFKSSVYLYKFIF